MPLLHTARERKVGQNTRQRAKVCVWGGDEWAPARPKDTLRRPGIEPGSTAWKAAMLTIIPPTPWPLAGRWEEQVVPLQVWRALSASTGEPQ